jgi:hypothetical protein
VELDCWDGSAGEPVIYHGHTLTTRILFEDVVNFVSNVRSTLHCILVAQIRALAEYGFRSTPYPLILSLEVHCTPKQQDRMADILCQVFGDTLAQPLKDSANHYIEVSIFRFPCLTRSYCDCTSRACHLPRSCSVK